MIHYTCDLCKKELKPEETDRFIIKVEIFKAIEEASPVLAEDDCDSLWDLNELLEEGDEAALPVAQDGDQVLRFDLCGECCKKIRKNPLGRDMRFDFSSN